MTSQHEKMKTFEDTRIKDATIVTIKRMKSASLAFGHRELKLDYLPQKRPLNTSKLYKTVKTLPHRGLFWTQKSEEERQ